MASPLPCSQLTTASCDRHSCVRQHSSQARPRISVAVSQEHASRPAKVRGPSITCQACTPSGTPGDGHETRCSSLFRAGPSGNSEIEGNTSGPEPLDTSAEGVPQPHQHSGGESGYRPPVVGSEPVGTVVICGWLGSNKRYLKRYQDWWTQNRWALQEFQYYALAKQHPDPWSVETCTSLFPLHSASPCCRWEPVVFMMPMRGALTLGATAQDLVEALVMQLAERKARLRITCT